jgi:hypothetical protein
MSARLRLVLAGAAFLAWMGYLGYAAVTKSRAPIVSRIQASAASAAVVAEVSAAGDRPSPAAVVAERLWGEGPTGTVEVVNLAEARGFAGPGKYLLYLVPAHEGWALVGAQHSPGDGHRAESQPPLIYPWGEDVREQAEKLKPRAKG